MTPSARKKNVFTFLLALAFLVCVLPIRSVAMEQPTKRAIGKSYFAYKKAPVARGAGNISFSVKMTVRGGSEEDKNKEFTLVGMFRSGKFRKTVAGDKWFGKSDTVYDNIKLYDEPFNYQKINSENGSILATGTVKPSPQGIFIFRLKQNEQMKFSVKKTENLGFFLYQSPAQQFTTHSLMGGQTFTGTTNVRTGEVIGVGAIPGGMQTVYYENHPLGYGTEYMAKLKSISSNADIEYVNTKKGTPKTYNVTYKFTSNTPNKTLPQEITALLPPTQTNVADGSKVTPTYPATTQITLSDGVWNFDGYQWSTATVNGADLEFVGRWSYTDNSPKQPPTVHPDETYGSVFSANGYRGDNSTFQEPNSESNLGSHTQPEETEATHSQGYDKHSSIDINVVVTVLITKLKGKVDRCYMWIMIGCIIMCVTLFAIWWHLISDLFVLIWYAKKKKRNLVNK